MVKNNKILLAGPWVGEFGWELFCWQGYLRNLSKQFDKTIIISRKGHQFLYNDFCDKYIEYNPPKNQSANSWMCGGVNYNIINKIKNDNPHTQYIDGSKRLITYNANYNGVQISGPFKNQEYIKYESNSLKDNVDILLHARNKTMGGVRNWDKNNWELLVSMLKNHYTVGVIGSHEAFGFEGVKDFRGVPIEDTVALMNRCKLVIGQSSGPMHLASLSGARHFVWSEGYNRVRYEKDWNPHKTPIYFYGNGKWNPQVNDIYNEIIKIVK